MSALDELVAPAHTAIVTQECQGAVVGPNAGLALLAEEARRIALPNITRLLPAARAAGVRVVHCVVQRRPDGLGSNLRVSTIVVVGVSLNIAIPNVVMDAVNAAYRVVVPRDAVAGIPADYGAAMITNTLSLLATITSTDDLLQAWGRPDEGTL